MDKMREENLALLSMDEVSRGSQRSMSASSFSSEELMSATAGSGLDLIFPLFDETTRIASMKSIPALIIMFVVLLETFITSYFPFLPGFWNLDVGAAQTLKVLSTLLDFGCHNDAVVVSYAPTIIIIVIAFLCFIWVASLLGLYYLNKTFNRASIFFTRFILSVIVPLIFYPSIGVLSFNFNAIFNQDESRRGVFIILTLCAFFSVIIISGLFYLDTVFRSSTPYLEKTCFAQWEGRTFFWYCFVHGMTLFSSRLLLHFNAWTRYFLVVIYILHQCYAMRRFGRFPFVQLNSNCVMLGLVGSQLISAVFSITGAAPVVKIGVPIPLFILCVVSARFTMPKMRAKIVEDPQYDTETNSLRSLRVLLAEAPEKLVDWTLVRQITATHPTTRMFIRLAQVLAFFPSESRMLNNYVKILSNHSDLTFEERFLFYQIRRVHVLRQSSATAQSNYDFDEVKKATTKTIACFSQYFAGSNELSLDTLVGLASINKKTNAICSEAIEKYPNSARLGYEYSRYLIECHAKFKEGAIWHTRAEMMDNGKHHAIDYAFRAIVNLFPSYLKKGILDYRGKKVSRTHVKSGSTSASSSWTQGNFNDEENEQGAEKIFDKPRLRLALERAVNNMKFQSVQTLKFESILRYVLSISVLIVLYALFKTIYDNRMENPVLIHSIESIRKSIAIGLNTLAYIVGSSKGVVNELIVPSETPEYNIFADPANTLVNYIIEGVQSSQEVGEMLSKIDNITKVAAPYLSNGEMKYCRANQVLEPIQMSSRAIATYSFYGMLNSANPAVLANFMQESIFCELLANTQSVSTNLDLQTQSFTERERQTADDYDRILGIALVICPSVLFVLLVVPLIASLIMLNQDVKKLFSVISMLPKDVIREGSKPIAKNDLDASTAAVSIEPQRAPRLLLPFVTIIGMVVSIGAIELVIYNLYTSNTALLDLACWLDLSSRRAPAMIESITTSYYALLFVIIGPQSYGTTQEQLKWFESAVAEVMDTHRDLLLGTETMKSCNEFSERLDEIHYGETCDASQDVIGGTHASYSCRSLDQMIMTYRKFANDLIIDFASPSLTLGFRESWIHLHHIAVYHILPKLVEATSIFSEGCKERIDYCNRNNLIIVMFSFWFITALFVVEIFIIAKINSALNVMRVLIARFPPTAVIGNQPLLDLIIGRVSSTKVQTLSASQAVIDSSPDAIIAISADKSIEGMNPAASTIFGYTPEQLLGQSLTSIIPSSEQNATGEDGGQDSNKNNISDLYRQMELMRAKQASMTYSCKAVGIKDDETPVNLDITLLGINGGESFALIANDQTIVLKQQKEVEDAKKQAEKLLYQILPRDIVTRMNRGEKDISFTVPVASIVFIDVVKFSDYSASLTPKQIMKNLGTYFKTWDDLIQNYKTIIKIKLIGDVYMAAAGLFDPEIPPSVHAAEMVSFTIDGLKLLEDVNHTLDANLSVRIGVNTGGPIIAGVLGTDKPLFDIIGDPINVAARLQSTDVPNNTQISQATYELIRDKNFNIEERGEVVLKGKGKQMTYLVSPMPESSPLGFSGSSFLLSKMSMSSRRLTGRNSSFASQSGESLGSGGSGQNISLASLVGGNE